jgi:thioredoxin-dependent peroxiredoxin
MPNIGDLAPDFELTNQDGKRVKLSDYRGKRVVVFAFTKAGV